ncbi:hypothetical protein KSP35_12960 [Aquihabitans sp. G128]|nr:hypothetical protein KSP35_12960 [Aquihabitans sp. G128]
MKGTKRRRPDRGADAWELRVELGLDPLDGRRRQRSETFRGTERQADTALAQLVAKVAENRHGPGTDATLSVLLDRWLEMVGDDLSPTTLAGYRSTIKVQIAPALGHRPVGSITTPELDSFYRALLAGPAGGKARKPATVRQTHAILRRAFRQAVRWGWLSTNPAVEATPPRNRKVQLRIPTPAQVAALITAADASDPELGCLLRLAVATGAPGRAVRAPLVPGRPGRGGGAHRPGRRRGGRRGHGEGHQDPPGPPGSDRRRHGGRPEAAGPAHRRDRPRCRCRPGPGPVRLRRPNRRRGPALTRRGDRPVPPAGQGPRARHAPA